MSDRIPEDLPVRKCINVVVGITRSKVIFIFFRNKLDFGRVHEITTQKTSTTMRNPSEMDKTL